MIISEYRAKHILGNWLEEAHVKHPVMFKINYKEERIEIYTDRPGYLIGRKGELIDKYRDKFILEGGDDINIKLIETSLAYSYYKE